MILETKQTRFKQSVIQRTKRGRKTRKHNSNAGGKQVCSVQEGSARGKMRRIGGEMRQNAKNRWQRGMRLKAPHPVRCRPESAEGRSGTPPRQHLRQWRSPMVRPPLQAPPQAQRAEGRRSPPPAAHRALEPSQMCQSGRTQRGLPRREAARPPRGPAWSRACSEPVEGRAEWASREGDVAYTDERAVAI